MQSSEHSELASSRRTSSLWHIPILLSSRSSEQWARTVEQTGRVLKRVQLQVEREALCESIAQVPTKIHTPKDTVIFFGHCACAATGDYSQGVTPVLQATMVQLCGPSTELTLLYTPGQGHANSGSHGKNLNSSSTASRSMSFPRSNAVLASQASRSPWLWMLLASILT